MSKRDDIALWHEFIQAIKRRMNHDTGYCDSYFAELLDAEELVKHNIKNDIMPFVGFYTRDTQCETVKAMNDAKFKAIAEDHDIAMRNLAQKHAKRVNRLEQIIDDYAKTIEDLAAHDIRMLNKRHAEIEAKQKKLDAELDEISRKQMLNLDSAEKDGGI